MKTISKIAIFFYFSFILFPTIAQKAGTISPNAKYLNLDWLESDNFNEGVCVVGKNGYAGLINSNGDFVYNLAYAKSFKGSFSNGNILLFELPNQSQSFPSQEVSGLVSQNGQTILTLKGYGLHGINKDRIVLNRNQNYNSGVIIDRMTTKTIGNFSSIFNTKFTHPLNSPSHGLPKLNKVRVNDFLNGNFAAFSITFISKGYDNLELWGFCDVNGKVIVQPNYYEVGDVSEGICSVKKKDSSGNESWGYVNDKGEIEIDFMFSTKPRPFYEGKAKFTSNQFNGFIDRKGNLLFKTSFQDDGGEQNKFDRNKALPEINENIGKIDFHENIALLGNKVTGIRKLIDNKGNIITLKLPNGGDVVSHFRNGKAIFSTYDNRNGESVFGMINTKGEIILQPIFVELLPFDTISGLAKARKRDLKTGQYIDGYINSQGEFTIVMQEAKTTKY